VTDLLNTVVAGLSSGSIYALVGIGFAFLFATGRYMNFAHGDWAMFGGMTAAAAGGAGVAVAALVAPITAAVVAAASYVLVLRRSRSRDVLTLSLILLGLGSILQGIALWRWGPTPVGLSSLSTLGAWNVGGVVIKEISAIVVGCAAVALLLVTLFLRGTRTGRAMSAWSENPEAAALAGIPVHRVSLIAFALAGLLAGVAGFLLLALTGVGYQSGLLITINAFGACAIGGFTSPVRAAGGGIVLGLIEGATATYVGGNYSQAVTFAVVFVIVFFVARRYREEETDGDDMEASLELPNL
jgi:branched-chain amino acid transport system permease protein